jgi:hypothetical protein
VRVLQGGKLSEQFLEALDFLWVGGFETPQPQFIAAFVVADEQELACSVLFQRTQNFKTGGHSAKLARSSESRKLLATSIICTLMYRRIRAWKIFLLLITFPKPSAPSVPWMMWR